MGQSDTKDSKWDSVSHVISSQYRVETMERLDDSPATPSRISEDTSMTVPHVSRALQELVEENLVELLVSEDRKKGRVYGITDLGEEVMPEVEATA